MSSSINIKAAGLVIQPNQLEVPPGSLTEANNIIIKRDNVVEPRRGIHIYGTNFPSIADRAKQLFTYKTRLLRHYFDNDSSTNLLQFDSDGQGTFNTFAGTYNEAQIGLRIKSIESNGNFYFTTDQGIEKISAKNPTDLSTVAGYITPAGGIKATDVSAVVKLTLGDVSGFLPQDSTVAYRIVWGSNDANGNLILGTPSQRAEVYNPLINSLLLDYSNLLQALDGIAPASLINFGQYVNTFKLDSNASASDLYSALQNLCTELDNDILYADNVAVAPLQIGTVTISGTSPNTTTTINFTSGNPQNYFTVGSLIRLAGFTPTSGTINNQQQITLLTPTSLSFNSTTAVGPVTLSTPTINSFEYEARSPSTTQFPLQVGTVYPLPATPPTDNDLVNLQSTLQSIISRLQTEPNATINTSVASVYIAPLSITTTASVLVTFSVPQDVTLNNFFQIYRSAITQATGTSVLSTLEAGDEMKLVYEAFITPDQLAARTITIEDITPDSFAGAYLYSNQISGEGALQTNDVPPFALDIAKFKNVTFYANTRTRQRLQISLLGVANMVANYDPSNPPQVTITDGVKTNTYTFIIGKQQITNITTNAGSTLAASGNSSYFTINSANDTRKYYVWYQIGTSVDPAPVGFTGIKVIALSGDTTTQIAEKTRDAISSVLFDFNVNSSSNVVTVENIDLGYTSNPTAATSGFTITVTQSGSGENASLKEVLLSTSDSPSQAVDDTARSFIRVVNQNINDDVNLFYLSSTSGVPGQLFAESRELNDGVFYFLGNNSITGASFSPDISPDLFISNISAAGNAVITTTTPHHLVNSDSVVISNSNSTPSIDGVWPITYISSTQFSIPFATSVSGNKGAIKVTTDAVSSDDEALPNRIYYSKLDQPEAVPIVNTLDIGAKDKAILRIFALRDSLFVFKEDGLFRISGEVAPFTVSLFDASTILIAPDSLSLCNNLIYGWTTQGISATGESGVSTVSRPIDIDILKLASNNYPNFTTITWGLGYESDNSYTVYTNENTTDTIATIGYRYSNLTNTWTTIDKSTTCGVINSTDDKMYLGPGDINYIEAERKTFTRLDYADREILATINARTYQGTNITLSNISSFSIGDAFVQDQLLSIYTFNSLLQKLDLDTDIGKATITNITTGFLPTITTSVNHNLAIGQFVSLKNTMSNPSIDGIYQVVTAPTSITFTVKLTTPVVTGASGGFAKLNYTQSLAAVGGDDLSAKIITLANTLDNDPATQNKNYFNLVKSIASTITNISIANPTIITSVGHGLVNGRVINLSGTNSNAIADGIYQITKIDNDHFSIPFNVIYTAGTTGSYFTVNSDFRDIVAGYNAIINNLNNDNGASFKNYIPSSGTTELEAIIVDINPTSKTITLSDELDFIVGTATVFKAIDVEFTYSPNTMGDPLSLKHISESTVMFENKAFTNSTYSFASDLHPAFVPVTFNGDGNGIFGMGKMGAGYFGGNSNGVPFRTYVPQQCQRCRYLLLKIQHKVAREKISVFGITISGMLTSSRAYR